MIIEFRVKNFRSIRDEQILSFVPTPQDIKEENKNRTHHFFETGLKQKTFSHLCSVMAIYGANAGGKSNLIKALRFFILIIRASFKADMKDGFPYEKFALDNHSEKEPSEFELTFLYHNKRYQYGFSLSSHRVLEEWLYVYESAQPQKWFERIYDTEQNKDDFHFGTYLKGEKTLWEKSTRDNALFLSTASHLNSEQLNPLVRWLSDAFIFIDNRFQEDFEKTMEYMGDNKERKEKIIEHLKRADFNIHDIEKEEEERKGLTVHFTNDEPEFKVEKKKFFVPKLVHRSPSCQKAFDFSNESSGTQRFFEMLGILLDAIEHKKCVIIDEIEDSLHHLLVRHIIELFYNPMNKAQIFFTTHDVALLDSDLFYRSQIWFSEKNTQQATVIYCLSQFHPRKNENFFEGYRLGRYDALPFIQSQKDECEDEDGF